MTTMILLSRRIIKMKVMITMLLLRRILMSCLGPEIVIIVILQIKKMFRDFLQLCLLQ